MTDPVKGISGAQATSAGGNSGGSRFSEEQRKKPAPAPQDDLIEISQDARDIASGKKKKNILDYLRDLLG